MLSVYTRHYPPCARTDIHYRRCHCPKMDSWSLGRATSAAQERQDPQLDPGRIEDPRAGTHGQDRSCRA